MNRQIALWMSVAGIVAGCQAPRAAVPPVPVTPASMTTPPAVKPAVDAVPPVVATPADPRVEAAIQQAAEQARAIAAIPETQIAAPPAAAGGAAAKGGTAKPPAGRTAPPKPPGVAAVESALAGASGRPNGKAGASPADADGFRPVPPITGATLISPDGKPFAPSVTPAADAVVLATAVTPPAVEPSAPPSSAVTPPSNPAITPPSNPAITPPAADPALSTPTASASASASVSTEPLGQQLGQRAREYPRDLAPQLDEQLLLLLKGDKVPTSDAMAGLNLEDRDVLTSVLDGLANFRGGIKQDGNLLITRKIRPLVEMADRLRSRADLSIVNASICRTIRGFGVFEAMVPARLPAGVNNKPKLYYEIENITPRLDGNNMWSTVMQQDLVLYDASGQAKWSLLKTPVTDLCRNRRRDFFFACVLNLPAELAAGTYTLKISLIDAAAGRVSEQSVPITLTATAAPNAPSGPVGPVLR